MFLLLNYVGNSANNNNSVMANKRISCHRLLANTSIKGNLRGLLERGVQESMDKDTGGRGGLT
jgi:hypothetical protein